jgi:hypothetical protein
LVLGALLVLHIAISQFGENWPSSVNYIEVYTGQDDMFGIDQVQVLNSSGSVVQTFGADNRIAWCLSSDQNDGYSADCNGNPAHNAYFFYPDGTIF